MHSPAVLDASCIGHAPFSLLLLDPPCLPEGHDTEDGERLEFTRSSAGSTSGFQSLSLCIVAGVFCPRWAKEGPG